jgi:MoaA/NifB/PqqE/SkfB family radical SAM enzyme
MKVILLQLPVQTHDYLYSRENVPLALGYLAACAQSALPQVDVTIAPQEIMSYGGDARIIRWLEGEAPDLIGFGVAVWNLERTLHLCRELKQKLPKTCLVLGGPEVTGDNDYLLEQGGFDAGVVGEGEETFIALLDALLRGRTLGVVPGLLLREGESWALTPTRALAEGLDRIPSPYIGGILEPSFLGSVFLETVRGCPYRCAYCYYHKSYPRVRTFPLDRIRRELWWALERRVKDVTIIDPCFARRPHLPELLGMMAEVNSGGRFRVQCELNAEDLDGDLVRRLARAGVNSVEVGLQTTNRRALDLINRRFSPEGFLTGVRLLREAGIRAVVDIIVGLPGDTLDDVKRSVDFLVANEAFDALQLYPLSVLPGTELRRRARDLGLRYRRDPPYYVLETAEMGRDEIKEAFVYGENALGEDLFPLELPHLETLPQWSAGGPGVVSQIVVGSAGEGQEPAAATSAEIGQALTIMVGKKEGRASLREVRRFIEPLLAPNPFTLVDWVFASENFPRADELTEMLSWSLRKDHPLNGEDFATYSPIRSTQVFILRKPRPIARPIVINIPFAREDAPGPNSAPSTAERVFCVLMPPGLDPKEEDHLAWLEERLGKGENRRFRVSDAEEWEFGPREKDPRLRTVDLPCALE